MASAQDGERNQGRRGLILAALSGWILLIVVGSGRRSDDDPLVGVDNLDDVFTVAVLFFAFIGLVLLIVLNPFQSEWVKPEGRRKNGLGILFLFVFSALLFLRPGFIENLRENFAELEETEESELPGSGPAADDGPVETVAQATDILLLAAAAGAIAGLVLFLRSRTQPEVALTDEEQFEAELLTAIEQARTELTVGTDPRSSVLLAYAKLESVLESRGTKRGLSETAAEHVRRALADLRLDPGPITELAELFEIARFSDQEISRDQQRSAEAALQRSRSTLADLEP